MYNFLKRIYEPSTHAGLAAILQVSKSFLPQYAPYFDLATGVFGSLAVIISERKK